MTAPSKPARKRQALPLTIGRAPIPSDLSDLIRERRIIPFIGAGFSAALKLPDWDSLLRDIASEVQGAPAYEVIDKCCRGDPLQIAEYFFLKFDKSIGPIRYRISSRLQITDSPITSTAHVELANLNAQQIYTTNYDEAIERTFKDLGQPYSFVSLPKEIATADRARTQIIKYHGDLRHDHTLVLTESSYYKRLEFESPMDLKFRSDLLGKSVLFLGYSFRDINIRIIWFKLMEMMKDVPEADRPTSYIVRFEKNEVLEELYQAVGIRTIYLDPDHSSTTPEEKTALLADFMIDLSMQASPDGKRPGDNLPMHLSAGLLDRMRQEVEQATTPSLNHGLGFGFGSLALLLSTVRTASSRVIHPSLASQVDDLFGISASRDAVVAVLPMLVNFFRSGFRGRGAAIFAIASLLDSTARDQLLSAGGIPWREVWNTELDPEQVKAVVKKLEMEISRHTLGDHLTVAYAIDIAARIRSGALKSNISPGLLRQVQEALDFAALSYPSVKAHEPHSEGAPVVDGIVAGMVARAEAQTSAPRARR